MRAGRSADRRWRRRPTEPSLRRRRPRPNAAKSAVYECGVPSVAKLSERFPIKFYLVAMLFILFDVEVVFLLPWTFVYREFLAWGLPVLLRCCWTGCRSHWDGITGPIRRSSR